MSSIKKIRRKSNIRKRKQNIRSRNIRSRNKTTSSNKKSPAKKYEKKWDILIHATDFYSLQGIKDKGGLILDDPHKDVWIIDDGIRKIFGDYFMQKDNRDKIIKILAENGDNLTAIKNKTRSTLNPYYNDMEKVSRGIYDSDVYWLCTPGIYTHYIWNKSALKDSNNCWYFGCFDSPATFGLSTIILGISSKILQDQPWIACPYMYYGVCVQERKLLDGFYSTGNKSNKPNMSKIKKHINNIMKTIPPKRSFRAYPNSHEIIFDKIPLKYISFIITSNPSYVPNIRSLFPDIPVTTLHKYIQLPSKWLLKRYAKELREDEDSDDD